MGKTARGPSPRRIRDYGQPMAEPGRGLSRAGTAFYACGNVGAGLLFAFTNAALPLYLGRYGLPNVAIGFLSQERPPHAALAQILAGATSDRMRTRLGRRRPFILAAVPVTAIALLALATHPPLWIMVALLVLMTVAFAVAYGPYQALLADLVPSEERGRVSGVLQVGGMAGQIAVLALATMLWERAEAVVFGLVAAGLVIGYAIVVLRVREPRASAVSDAPTHPLLWLRDIAGQRQVVRYLVATFFFWFAFGGLAPFLTRFGVYELGTSEDMALGLFLIVVVSTVVCALPAGWLVDRYGKKRMLMLGVVLCAVASLIGSQVRTVEQAVVMLAIVGAANALSTVPQLPLLTDLIARERAGEMTGVGSAVWELSQPLGAITAGALADIAGTLRVPLVMAGLSLALAALLLTRVQVSPPQFPPADRRPTAMR